MAVLPPWVYPWFDPRVQVLAQGGYAVFQPNYRGSRGFDKRWMQAGWKTWGIGAAQHDISDGVLHLVASGVADRQRIAAFGGSFGGYAALSALAFMPELYRWLEPYRDMRLGILPKAEFDELLRLPHNFGIERSITETRAGEQGDTYFVTYPAGTQNLRLLEWHLTHGNSYEARYCLRIYFFWDKAEEEVVIGWLPSHLDNRLT